MKRITTTFFICLLLGITSLHAERDNHTQRTPEKQPEFITGFRYLPPGCECFADMFKYKVIDFPGFSTQDTLYFKKYTRPIKGYTVREIHALNGNRCNAYVLCFEKGNKKFFVGGKEEEGEYRDICLKAYNLHFDSAKKYTEYGSSTTLTFCFTDIDVDGKDELIIFSPYWGTCGFRIYDIWETPRDIRLKPVSKTDFDEARRLLVAPEEGVLLVWWRGCIGNFKMQKNADHSVSGFKYIDEVCSPGPSDFFLTYTLEEPD